MKTLTIDDVVMQAIRAACVLPFKQTATRHGDKWLVPVSEEVYERVTKGATAMGISEGDYILSAINALNGVRH